MRLARASLEAYLTGGPSPTPPAGGAMAARRGAFVSLHAGPELRGCIGQVAGDRPLGEVVARMAVAAGRDDPRFAPVTVDELAALHIEISVLSEPVRLEPVDRAHLVIGRDGLIVRRGRAFGVLLPQVASELGWTADAFLSAACHKAGLTPDAWRAPDTEVLVFQAEVFTEGLGARG